MGGRKVSGSKKLLIAMKREHMRVDEEEGEERPIDDELANESCTASSTQSWEGKPVNGLDQRDTIRELVGYITMLWCMECLGLAFVDFFFLFFLRLSLSLARTPVIRPSCPLGDEWL